MLRCIETQLTVINVAVMILSGQFHLPTFVIIELSHFCGIWYEKLSENIFSIERAAEISDLWTGICIKVDCSDEVTRKLGPVHLLCRSP